MPLLRRKFVIELTVFVLTFGIILNYGINLQTIAFLCFSYLLITQVAIDAFHQILPDEITYILLWLGLCQSLIPLFTPSFYAITGACFGYLFFYVIAWIFKKCTQKDGLGHGDFKLLAALGAWVGLGSVPLLVLFAGITALIGGLMRMAIRRDTTSTPFPFGPYLALSGWAILFLQSFYPALFSRLLLCLSLA